MNERITIQRPAGATSLRNLRPKPFRQILLLGTVLMGALLASGVFAYASAGSPSESSLSSALRSLGANAKYPDAVDDTATVDEDSVANAIDVLANDETHPRRTTTIVSVTQGSHGSVAISSGGDLVLYSPVADYFGGDSFTYTIFDGKFADTATVSVTVNGVNDPPVAVNDVAETSRETSVSIDVLANDSIGPDVGETFEVIAAGPAQGGTVEIVDDTAITYTPDPYQLADQFTYTISDGNGGEATAEVRVAVNYPPQGKGSITGRVTDESGNPIFGIDVQAFPIECCIGIHPRDAYSDPSGNYLIAGLAEGDYKVSFYPDFDGPFTREHYNDTKDWLGAQVISVGSDPVTGIDASLALGGVITGRVTDEEGNPIVGASVGASAWDSGYAITGEDGTYRIIGLETDDYLVGFSPPDGVNLVGEYYNDSVSFEGALRVHAVERETTSGIDAALAPGAAIEGTVTDENGLPIEGITVVAEHVDGISFADTPTGSDGGYRIQSLPAGGYILFFTALPPGENPLPAVGNYVDEYYDDVLNRWEATVVELAGGQTAAGIDASLATGGIVTGQVTDVSGNPVEGAFVSIWSSHAEELGIIGGTYSGANGEYLVDRLATDTYLAKFSAPHNANLLDQWYSGKPDFNNGDHISVVGGEITSGIDAALTAGGIVTGHVTDTSGDPLESIFVSARTAGGTWVGGSVTDSSGSYVIQRLGTAEFKIRFDGWGFVPEWFDNKPSLESADLVAVVAGQTTAGLDAVLLRVGEVVGRSDSYAGLEDTVLSVAAPGVLANDEGGSPLRASLYAGPSNGTVVLGSDGSFSYTPFSNFNGSDSFSYRATDGTNFSDPVTASLSIAAVNDPPSFTGGPDVVVDEDAGAQSVSAWATNISAGPDDEAGQGLVFQVETDNLSLFSAAPAIDPAFGHLSFTSAQNAYGGANVTVVLRDDGGVENGGANESAAYTFTITVNPVNDAPIVMNDSALTSEDNPVVIEVLANDYDVEGDPLTVTIVAGPGNGEAVVNPDGTVTYTPPPDEYGNDTFIYEVSDGNGGNATADVWVEIVSVNDTPQAEDDAASTDEDNPITLNVLANDSGLGDAKMNGPLTLALLSGPSNGSVALDSEGVVGPSPSGFVGNATYTPGPDFNGSDGFVYSVTDPDGETSQATVTITVVPINDPPVAVDDSVSTDEDIPVTADVLANDYDVDGDPLQVSISAGPSNGAAVVNPDGSITYTPDPDYNGPDSLTYSIGDPSGAAASAIVSITVTPVNDPPVAGDDSAETEHFTPVTVYVLANDFDVDADTLTVALVSGPSNGTVSCTPDGYCTYSPNFLFLGFDGFIYQVSDGNGGTDTATVTITVGLPSLPSPPKPPYLPPPY